MISDKKNYYEDIDKIFDNLYDSYGLNKDLSESKKNIIELFENIHIYYDSEIPKKLMKKNFKIDEYGIIKSC